MKWFQSLLILKWICAFCTLYACFLSIALFRLANGRPSDLQITSYQLSDFSITIVENRKTDDFELRLTHSSQPNNVLFSFSKYYELSGKDRTRLPFIFVSNVSLTKEPIHNGHQLPFLEDQIYNYFSNDITINNIQYSNQLCLNLTGDLLFTNKQNRNNKNNDNKLENIAYLFSLCVNNEPFYPYYKNDTAYYLQSAVDINIEILGPSENNGNNFNTRVQNGENGKNDNNNENRNDLENENEGDSTITQSAKQYNRIVFSYDVQSPDEAYLGFGEQYSYFNLRNRYIPIIISEQGVGRGLEPITSLLNRFYHNAGGYWHTSYMPKATYLTNRNYSILFENYDIMVFDMANSDPDLITIECFANDSTDSIQGKIIFGEKPLDIVEQVSLISGRMKPMPEWVSKGHVLGIEGGSHYVLNKTIGLIESGVKLSGIWIQDWVGLVHNPGGDGSRLMWNWQLNSDQYPNYNEMVSLLRDEYDVRVLTYINPHFSNVSHLQRSEFGLIRNYFKEGIDNGYFIKNANDEPYLLNSLSLRLATVDLTNSDAVRWIKDIIINNLIVEGRSSGFMADFGEYTPFDCVLHSDTIIDADGNSVSLTPSTYHNYFPHLWAQVVREAIEEAVEKGLAVKDDIVAFHRSGHLKTPKYATAYWLGDQLVTWDHYDGLRSILYGFFSSGLSGVTKIHSDTGGYSMIKAYKWVLEYVRTQELLLRWIELNTFTDTFFRSHPGNRPNDSVQVFSDEKTVEHIRYFSNVFAALSDYKHDLEMDAYQYGYPIVRHMYLHYWNDPVILQSIYNNGKPREIKNQDRGLKQEEITINEQFMLGECMLVGPVLRQGQYMKRMYLPQGRWISYWNKNEVVDSYGQFYEFLAPLGKPPVFVCEEWKYAYYEELDDEFNKYSIGGSKGWNSGNGSSNGRSWIYSRWTVIGTLFVALLLVAVLGPRRGYKLNLQPRF